MAMKIVFNDSYKSNGFEYGVEAINKLLERHDLKVDITFIDDYGLDGVHDAISFEDNNDDGEFAWKVEVAFKYELELRGGTVKPKMSEAREAMQEASSSIACCLDEPDDVTQSDLEHIQNQITILENYMGV